MRGDAEWKQRRFERARKRLMRYLTPEEQAQVMAMYECAGRPFAVDQARAAERALLKMYGHADRTERRVLGWDKWPLVFVKTPDGEIPLRELEE